MNIKVHRGLEQIGGCITEISTATSRVFIDFGQNLPGVGEPTTPEQDHKMVAEIFAHNKKAYEAVLYTHGHEDHIGLCIHIPESIPQYIGQGAKELLLAKYEPRTSLQRKLCSALLKLITEKGEKIAAIARRTEKENRKKLDTAEQKLKCIKNFKTWDFPLQDMLPPAIEVGDIRITPFRSCHSIYDSYMFLIEADGKRIWHTGDYREHGYMGKNLIPTLRRYATNIDTLITEGTLLNQDTECIHESEVSRRMSCMLDAFKYVVVLTSATDIERLAAIQAAAKKSHRDMYICSRYMEQCMEIFTKHEARVFNGLFEFDPKMITLQESKIPPMPKEGFVLIAGPSYRAFAKEVVKDLNPADVLLIYSSWDGYYKDPEQVKLNPRYKEFRDSFSNVVDIHTPGHADKKTIHKVIDTIKPKEVIVIHTEATSLNEDTSDL